MSNHGDADDVLHVAIVGGGALGLASAYHLMQRARRLGAFLDVHVFDGREAADAHGHVFATGLAAAGQPPAARNETAHAPMNGSGLAVPLIRTVHRAAMALRGRIRLDYTCGRFFDDCLRDPEALLDEAARALSLSIDWRDARVLDALVQVRDGYYYPLISTMFLCDPSGPQNTPVQAALEYIRWKEDGRSLAENDFTDDASRKWAESLAAHLEERSDEQVSVTIRSGGRLLVRVMSDMVEVLREGQSRIFDICVMANSPGDALRVLAFDAATAAFGVRVGGILDSVCETDDESAWYGGDGMPGASPTDTPPGGGAGWRPGVWDNEAPGSPSARPPPPSTRYAPEDKAWAAFRHHVFDVSVKARADIRALNETFVEGWREGMGRVPCAEIPPLLFVGGWPYGAVLQEQCMEQAEELGNWLLPE
ncbi:FAD-dependent oxidoreductase [Paracidovorax cattleyae]|uniref:FAD dependent oxidoreductase n=1 Tax=Paracidovorax cattleyae TaxID=80868 RepID=A0A1H0K137_9BURK|nr:FAD-dependent oxidoreductase [Paracidovorax cattleyae]AVS73677.1 FAD-dependent oxidoreductase [Paracidovorax cattleyae]MBF9266529.1 FAD-dependent oxidoreductase [Paracidovorax cattleyae]SDO49371.1 FAD dependent oxidoreductase [Paracidovorax cattleyae]